MQRKAEGEQKKNTTNPRNHRAKAWQPLAEQAASVAEGSAGDARTLGEDIEAFLTGASPAPRDETWVPLAPRRSGPGLQWRLAPATGGRRDRELDPSEAIARLADLDSRPPPRRGPLGWLIKQPMDFLRLVTLRKVYEPSLLPSVAAALVLAPFPHAGFVAVHELGHFLMSRLTGVPTYQMRYLIPDGMPTRDGFVIQGYVVTARWERPVKQLAVLWAGPLAGWAYYLTTVLTFLGLAGALATTPWLWPLAIWNALILLAGWPGFRHGHSGDFLGIARVNAEMRRSPTRVLELDSGTMDTARLLGRIHSLSETEILRRGLDALARFSAAADREGKVTVAAGGKSIRFRIQSESYSLPADRPLARPLAGDEETVGAVTLEMVALALDPEQVRAVERLKRRHGHFWTEQPVSGGVALLAYLQDLERSYGRVSLLEDGRFTPLILP